MRHVCNQTQLIFNTCVKKYNSDFSIAYQRLKFPYLLVLSNSSYMSHLSYKYTYSISLHLRRTRHIPSQTSLQSATTSFSRSRRVSDVRCALRRCKSGYASALRATDRQLSSQRRGGWTSLRSNAPELVLLKNLRPKCLLRAPGTGRPDWPSVMCALFPRVPIIGEAPTARKRQRVAKAGHYRPKLPRFLPLWKRCSARVGLTGRRSRERRRRRS